MGPSTTQSSPRPMASSRGWTSSKRCPQRSGRWRPTGKRTTPPKSEPRSATTSSTRGTCSNETYTIYIINLVDDSEPDPSPGKWVYVGETSKTPEERFDEHKNGIRDNKAARDHGRDLNYDLMKRIPQVRFKQDSKWLEAHAGEKLRDCGYKVEGAH